jgi:hypothetical protein
MPVGSQPHAKTRSSFQFDRIVNVDIGLVDPNAGLMIPDPVAPAN